MHASDKDVQREMLLLFAQIASTIEAINNRLVLAERKIEVALANQTISPLGRDTLREAIAEFEAANQGRSVLTEHTQRLADLADRS